MRNAGSSIEIVTNAIDDDVHGCGLETSIELYVPDGSRLDLRTGVGSIYVTGSPAEIKAENRGGIELFELNPEPAPELAGGRASRVNLRGWGGLVEIKLQGKKYLYSGVVQSLSEVDSPRS
jgi:hypothetical protein